MLLGLIIGVLVGWFAPRPAFIDTVWATVKGWFTTTK